MPVVQLPISQGLVTSNQDADWLDALPVNLLSVPKNALNATGYMRSWPGLDVKSPTQGTSRGAVYNVVDNKVYRVSGTKFTDNDGNVIADVGGSGYAPMPFSINSQAIVSNGVLNFWRDGELTQLKNWAQGERILRENYTPNYRGGQHVTIPDFDSADYEITAKIFLKDNIEKQWILASSTTTTAQSGIFVEDGNFVYQKNLTTTEVISPAVIGENDFTFSRTEAFTDPISLIAAVKSEDPDNPSEEIFTGYFSGELYYLVMTDKATTTNSRDYDSVISLTAGSDAPDTPVLEDKANNLDGTMEGFEGNLWKLSDTAPDPSPSPATDFNIGFVIDACRNKGRYLWISRDSGLFGVTDIQNEQRPDYIAPFYSAETDPDRNLGIEAWKGYAVVFGRYTTEFFSLTGNLAQIYQPNNSLAVRAGIVGTGAKCQFLESFAIVGGPADRPVSVYIIGQGSYKEIATRRIQKILREYSDDELSETVYIEQVKFDAHQILLIHLPRHVLSYDHAAAQAGANGWSILKTDTVGNKAYRGIHHIYDGSGFSCGDKRIPQIMNFNFSSASHAGQKVEFSVFTPMVQVRNKRLFDLEVDNIPGRPGSETNLAFSVTYDGISYREEKWTTFSTELDYTQRVLERTFGYVHNNVGFKLRWITDKPTSISDFRVRIQ